MVKIAQARQSICHVTLIKIQIIYELVKYRGQNEPIHARLALTKARGVLTKAIVIAQHWQKLPGKRQKRESFRVQNVRVGI